MATPRTEVIAKLVGSNEDVTATAIEREIAGRLRQLGECMERQGYLPEIRRREMARRLYRLISEASDLPDAIQRPEQEHQENNGHDDQCEVTPTNR